MSRQWNCEIIKCTLSFFSYCTFISLTSTKSGGTHIYILYSSWWSLCTHINNHIQNTLYRYLMFVDRLFFKAHEWAECKEFYDLIYRNTLVVQVQASVLWNGQTFVLNRYMKIIKHRLWEKNPIQVTMGQVWWIPDGGNVHNGIYYIGLWHKVVWFGIKVCEMWNV
jgi:hypothetical protein